MDAGAFSCGVFTGFKKAFDTIDHSILIHKLDFYGFRGIIDAWFRSYLQDRTQITVIDQRPSNKSVVTYWVSQGSVLGSLLFFCTSMIYTPAQTNLTFIYGSSYCVIVRVSVILKRTVVGDWRLDNLNGSHFQSQVNNICQSMMF